MRYDLFGFGLSSLAPSFSSKKPAPPIRHHDHAAKVAEAYLKTTAGSGHKDAAKFIVIGLSRGGGIAIDFALARPDIVAGLVLCAGALHTLDVPNTPLEDSFFSQLNAYMNRNDIENATNMVS